MADTAALVVALSAQLTKFEKDMQKAGIMAERAVGDIEGKFAKMNPKVSTSFLGNFLADMAGKGVDAAIKAVGELITRFQDLQKTAEYAGVSLQWLYGVQEAGAKAGASVGDINEAVKSLAFSLDELKRGGDNPLKTLLDANPKFMKGVNRDTMDVAKSLEVVSNIIQALPNQVQRVDVATKLGMPASAVALLEKGGAAVAEMAAKAEKAGPALEKMAAQSKAITQWWALFIDNLSSGVINAFFEGLKIRLEQLIALFEKLQFGQEGTALGNFIDKTLPSLRAAAAEMEKVNKPRKIEVKGGTTTGGGAIDPFARKTAAPAAQRDEFERANDQITKHIKLMEADAAAVGKGVAEQERLRTSTLLMEAERRRLNLAEGEAIPISAELAAKIEAQAQAAGRAAQALAEAQFKLQQINSASQQVGSAVSTAFADAIIEGKKLNEVLDSLVKTLLKAALNASIMSLFTPGAGGGTAPFAKMLGFAEGTNSAPGGLAMVGEKGPELVNLPRGAQVIPNDVLRNSTGGGGAIVYSPAIDARGASVEAVARLAQIMEADRAAFASRTIATIQQARRGRVPGV